MNVIPFSRLGWPLYCNQGQWAELGYDEDNAGQDIGSDSRFTAIMLPIVVRGYRGHFIRELLHLRRIGVSRLMAAMQQRDGIGNARDEIARREAVAGNVEPAGTASGEFLSDSVGLVVSQRKLADGTRSPICRRKWIGAIL